MIVKLAEGDLRTKFGVYHETLYYNGQRESIALTMGDVSGEGVLCRIHSSCLFGHAFNSVECDCREQMGIAQQLIEKEGRGIVIWLDQEGKGNGHFALLKSMEHKRKGLPQADAYEAVGFKRDARDFTVAAEILKDLRVQSVVLLTNSSSKTDALTSNGIKIIGTKPLTEKN